MSRLETVLSPKALMLLERLCKWPTPSLRELGAYAEIKSPNGVLFHLDRLEKLGLVRRDRGKARTAVPTFKFISAEALSGQAD